ncbi:MAG: hypothetical protein Q9166_002075 [cf. Caloplaca sp. 2 TL-2023]
MGSTFFKKYPEADNTSSVDVDSPTIFQFMNLPIEIRYMIYELLMTRFSKVYRYPHRTTAPASKIASCGCGVLYDACTPYYDPDQVYDWELEHHDCSFPTIPDLNLLLVNRQIYAEAAPFFYGGNQFLLAIGIMPHYHCKAQVWDFVDDLKDIRKEHLRLMRSIRLRVRVFDFSGRSHHVLTLQGEWKWPRDWAKKSYLAVRERLESFAAIMRSKHSLSFVTVFIDGFLSAHFDEVDRIQNALEPLASIYGIKYVAVGGVTLDFAKRLVYAMQMDHLVVEKIPELHVRRKLRGSRRGRGKHLYQLRPYMDSRYKFGMEAEEGAPLRPKGEIVTKVRGRDKRTLRWRVVVDYRQDPHGRAVMTEVIT